MSVTTPTEPTQLTDPDLAVEGPTGVSLPSSLTAMAQDAAAFAAALDLFQSPAQFAAGVNRFPG